jgi:RNA polymerase sigma-70 factor (ECF subfamily)
MLDFDVKNICLEVMDIPPSGRRDGPGSQSTERLSSHESTERAQLVELLGRTGQGDQTAFARLYELTARRVFGMARRILVDAELSEDATQEVYLQVWKRLPDGLRLRPSSTAWIR